MDGMNLTIAPGSSNVCTTITAKAKSLDIIIVHRNIESCVNDESGINLDLHKSENLSLRRYNQTRSPGSNTTCFLPLSPASLYLAFILPRISLTNSCIFNINSARCLASKLTFSEDGRDSKSIGARGRKP